MAVSLFPAAAGDMFIGRAAIRSGTARIPAGCVRLPLGGMNTAGGRRQMRRRRSGPVAGVELQHPLPAIRLTDPSSANRAESSIRRSSIWVASAALTISRASDAGVSSIARCLAIAPSPALRRSIVGFRLA